METVQETARSYGILVVDDERDVPELFRQLLRREVRRGRYELFFSQSGVEALDFLEEDAARVDLLITDINMPEMDGLTLLERVRAAEFNLRAVVLSAYGDMKNIRGAMNRGAFDFVVKPVDFDDLQATMERSLANLELWREAEASKLRLQTLNHDVELAWRVQNALLPKVFPSWAAYDLHAVVEPARSVSGDFYDVIQLERGRVALVVADVSGKGLPAAMLMMSVRTMVRGLAIGLSDPGKVLAEANALLVDDRQLGSFVTMFFGVFDPDEGTLSYALAGHDPPVVFGAGRSPEVRAGAALGLLKGEAYPVSSLSLAAGEGLCVFTDGVTEAEGADGGFYGRGRLEELLCGGAVVPAGDAAGQVRRVVEAVQAFAGGRVRADDLTCLVLLGRAAV